MCRGPGLISSTRSTRGRKAKTLAESVAVDTDGVAETIVTGIPWRSEVCQQVFEEAAVDCGRALATWSESRSGRRNGKRVGFPRFKKKTGAATGAFRLRNKHAKGRLPGIRVGDHDRQRSVTLPGIGQIDVHDDTRQLRRMLAKERAKILFATISHHGGRWWVALNVEAADLHPAHQHPPSDQKDSGGWVGVDRGLSAFLVAATADGIEVGRVADAPKALARGLKRQRRLAKSLSRKQKGSRNRRGAVAKLGRHHHRVANARRHFLHQLSNKLVKTHDRLVIEDLNVSGNATPTTAWPKRSRMQAGLNSPGSCATNRRGAAVELCYGRPLVSIEQALPGTAVTINSRADPRTIVCSPAVCGHSGDRDLNAAVNLARWGHTHHDPQRSPGPPSSEAGPPTPADGTALTSTPRVPVKPARMKREPTFTPHQRPEPTTPEKGGAERSAEWFGAL